MRLDRLSIPNYRNLRGFEIDFDESRPTTVLLGRNGTGKSNLIEAIVEIFRELELGGVPSFAYRLEYVCREQIIHVDADPERKSKRLAITVDGKALTQKASKDGIDRYLPNYVFAYYSGWSSRLERHFDRPTRTHYNQVLKSRDREMPLRRLFFCRKDYSQLVLLAFFLAPSATARGLLKDYLGIERFESALFVLKTPWWRGSGAPSKVQQTDGDPRFWYARGAFKGFLDRLWTRALAPIRNTEAVERDVRRQGESTERLYLFLKNEVRFLAQEGERIVAAEPEYDPIGIGVEGLLKSELYGLRSTLAPEILQKLDQHYQLLGKIGQTDDEQRQLMRLVAELNDLGVSRTHPNPYFELFANALAGRRPPEPVLELSKEELDAQTELADEVLEEILAEERADETGKGS